MISLLYIYSLHYSSSSLAETGSKCIYTKKRRPAIYPVGPAKASKSLWRSLRLRRILQCDFGLLVNPLSSSRFDWIIEHRYVFVPSFENTAAKLIIIGGKRADGVKNL